MAVNTRTPASLKRCAASILPLDAFCSTHHLDMVQAENGVAISGKLGFQAIRPPNDQPEPDVVDPQRWLRHDYSTSYRIIRREFKRYMHLNTSRRVGRSHDSFRRRCRQTRQRGRELGYHYVAPQPLDVADSYFEPEEQCPDPKEWAHLFQDGRFEDLPDLSKVDEHRLEAIQETAERACETCYRGYWKTREHVGLTRRVELLRKEPKRRERKNAQRDRESLLADENDSTPIVDFHMCDDSDCEHR